MIARRDGVAAQEIFAPENSPHIRKIKRPFARVDHFSFRQISSSSA